MGKHRPSDAIQNYPDLHGKPQLVAPFLLVNPGPNAHRQADHPRIVRFHDRFPLLDFRDVVAPPFFRANPEPTHPLLSRPNCSEE